MTTARLCAGPVPTLGNSLAETPHTATRPKRLKTAALTDCAWAVTPDCAEAHSAEPPVLVSAVHTQLQRWLVDLQQLHPACMLIPCEACTLALGIFREYTAVTALPYRYAATQSPVLKVVNVVCMWSAIKFLALGGCVSNARFMAKATGVPQKLLLAVEADVLRAVGWRLLAICHAVGLSHGQPEAS